MSTDFTVPSVHEFLVTAERAGWTPKDIDTLRKDKKLCQSLLAIVRRLGVAAPIFIECDKPLELPSGDWDFEVVNHRPSERFVTDSLEIMASEALIDTHLPVSATEEELLAYLADKTVLNYHVREFIIQNGYFFPESWQKKPVAFWGTLVRHKKTDDLFVPIFSTIKMALMARVEDLLAREPLGLTIRG